MVKEHLGKLTSHCLVAALGSTELRRRNKKLVLVELILGKDGRSVK